MIDKRPTPSTLEDRQLDGKYFRAAVVSVHECIVVGAVVSSSPVRSLVSASGAVRPWARAVAGLQPAELRGAGLRIHQVPAVGFRNGFENVGKVLCGGGHQLRSRRPAAEHGPRRRVILQVCAGIESP